MSEHFSHLFTGRLSLARAKKINKILKPFDAVVIPYHDPGSGHRGWIASPNQGNPYDQQRVQEMTAALKDADLLPLVHV